MKTKKIDFNKQDVCDIIVPVYNNPDWVKLCVYSIFVNTPLELLGKVFLIDDCSNEITKDCLDNLKKKYLEKIEIISNKTNQGFVKNVNIGLERSNSKYVMLLNTDCILSKDTVPKLISHIRRNPKIGMISPISNNSANVSLEMFDGFNYSQMNSLLEKKFLGMNFDACTIVGNCLVITRECINNVGQFDEVYGKGYGEETDYQFKAMEKGFEAKIAIDTYVFHKGEVSFGSSDDKKQKMEINRGVFFSRWGERYHEMAKKYTENDPIVYINSKLKEEDKLSNNDCLFYLPFITQNAGGCHVVFDITNYLVINGYDANILYDIWFDYQEIFLFKPIKKGNLGFKVKKIITTLWISVFSIMRLAEQMRIPIINFVQGYENYFENGKNYRSVELTHKIADRELVISKYLQDKLKKMFAKESTLISNGINYDLLYHENNNETATTIAFILRNNMMKGDFILLDIMKQLDNICEGLVFKIVYMGENSELPLIKNNKIIQVQGPISRLKIAEILKKTDIYVDASMNEGFGLIGLEAIACGAVPVVSNSFGVNEYLKDGINGYIVSDVNNSDAYVSKILQILNDKKLYQKIRENGSQSCKEFDFDLSVKRYVDFLGQEIKATSGGKKYSKEESEIINLRAADVQIDKKIYKGFFYYLGKLIPEFVKIKMKKIIDRLYLLYDHS